MKNEETISEMLSEARFIKNILGDSKEAIDICNKILKLDSACQDALLIKAGAMNELFMLDEAMELINQIINRWPEHWEGYYLLALNCFSRQKDEEGFKAIDKSIQLNKNFDNIITKAQLLYLNGMGDYMEYVDMAKKIDKKRAENFMRNHFTYDINSIKPTKSEIANAKKFLRSKKN